MSGRHAAPREVAGVAEQEMLQAWCGCRGGGGDPPVYFCGALRSPPVGRDLRCVFDCVNHIHWGLLERL